jgi:hypothetical protein
MFLEYIEHKKIIETRSRMNEWIQRDLFLRAHQPPSNQQANIASTTQQASDIV